MKKKTQKIEIFIQKTCKFSYGALNLEHPVHEKHKKFMFMILTPHLCMNFTIPNRFVKIHDMLRIFEWRKNSKLQKFVAENSSLDPL